jgi:hypothetical protein
VYTRASGISETLRLFNVGFDSCQGAPAPTLADFACTVEGCAYNFGPLTGCTCTVANP